MCGSASMDLSLVSQGPGFEKSMQHCWSLACVYSRVSSCKKRPLALKSHT